MSSQSELAELRSDIKKQTESINDLTVSIAQLLEGYKHHKEITERQGEEIKAVAVEMKVIDDKLGSFILNYKPFLDGAIKDKEKKSDRYWRVVMGWLAAIGVVVASFFFGIISDHFKPYQPPNLKQNTPDKTQSH